MIYSSRTAIFQFPNHQINVRGEEDGKFPAEDGKQVILEITDDVQNTT